MSASSAGDVPLYKSYFLGLDKIGLDNDDESWSSVLSDTSSDDSLAIYDNLERTKSAPLKKVSKSKTTKRPRSCCTLYSFYRENDYLF